MMMSGRKYGEGAWVMFQRKNPIPRELVSAYASERVGREIQLTRPGKSLIVRAVKVASEHPCHCALTVSHRQNENVPDSYTWNARAESICLR